MSQIEQTPSKFRGDVEGLRALAVLLVVLFHLEVPGLSGGFIGVDVFFVISGFVVTRSLWPKISAGDFRLRDFYVNRFWRLQPSYFLVGALTLLASALLLSDIAWRRAAEAALAATALAGNFFFWSTTSGYGTTSAEESPFLQMWSLGVEEQFYLLWPCFLLLLFRFRALRHPAVVAGLLLLAVGGSEWLAGHDGSIAYYLLPARIMELGLGGALVALEHKTWGPKISSVAGLVGLGALLISALGLTVQSRFPGLLALPACAGTALLIHSGAAQGVVYRLASAAPLRALGRVSYAWYLFHWPPIGLLHALAIPLTWPVSLAVGVSTLIAASLSYRFIESPTRRAPTRGYRALTAGLFVALVVGIVLPLVTIPSRPMKDKPDVAAAIDYKNLECIFGATKLAALDRCGGVKSRESKRILIWGDSHSKPYRDVMERYAERLGYIPTTVSSAGCPPLFGVRREDSSGNAKFCQGQMALHVDQLLRRFDFDALLVVTRVDLYEQGWRENGRLKKSTHFLSDEHEVGSDAEASTRVFHRQLRATMEYLESAHHLPIVFALPTPVLPRRPDQDKKRQMSVPRTEYEEMRARVVDTASRFPDRIAVIDPLPAVCDDDECPVWKGKLSYYSDDNHLSLAGARRLLPALEEALKQARPR